MGRFLMMAVLVLVTGMWEYAPSQAATGQLCVTSPRANLREGPGREHRITWEVNRFMPLIQIGQEGDWIKVRDVDGDTHWIFGELVTERIDCVTIKELRANVRKRPTSASSKWFTVEKYTSFKRVETKGKWVNIEYEGESMWLFHTLVWPEK